MIHHHHIVKFLVAVIVCSNMITSPGGSVMQNDGCNVAWCGTTEIRFPFHLKDRDALHNNKDQCVFPTGFQLSCDDEYGTGVFVPIMAYEYQVNTSLPGVYLSFPVEASVSHIDYKSRQLSFDGFGVFFGSTRTHKNYNKYQSKYPFKPFTSTGNKLTDPRHGYTFYKCPSTSELVSSPRSSDLLVALPVDSLSSHGHRVFVVNSDYGTVDSPLTSCTKMYNISDDSTTVTELTWSEPDCGHCEAKGQYCKFKQNSTIVTQCYPKGIVGGIFFILFTFAALYFSTKSYKRNKRYELKIEMFLKDYRALKPSRHSYADIKKMSNQFKVKIGEGGYGSVFKGQLSNDVVVAVKVLNDKVDAKGNGEDFINEVRTIGLVHHVNVVRLVGYCADRNRRALVYEYLPNNSLEKYVYSRGKQNKRFLGWEKMQDIALGIAKGIEYLHQGCAQPILHFDIKPQNILLDRNFNPKISDFGLAKLCTKGKSMVSMTMARGTIGYIAPEVFSRNFGKVSSKSDVYSFGMLLLEMVGARDNTLVGTENSSEAYFPEWVFHQLDNRRETTTQIREEVNSEIAKKLTIVGLWCINWHPADRPSMKHVIQMLQEEYCPAMPPNPFGSSTAGNVSTFSNTLEAISEAD
ncbi:hypothetical protein DCAR_0831929 [Daucus carota subsp. sativus]|uniref:Protein kinase domain-containing protein n=1 Tax=Daucus carota subsp. sativus TaxID=79200 RepID=A0AAF1BAN3_DAUCS|nr:hypothetical protein DCAR_0831929 [Daucus carota subsp. sativus]